MDIARASDRTAPRRHRRAAAVLSGLLLAGAMVLQGTPPLRATAAASDDATSYRIDAAHSGAQPGDTLATPLAQRWSVNLGGSVSYPLIAGGRVFVSVADSPNYGSRLYALDATTGATLWGPVELGGTYWFADSAYDNGRVFTIDFDGLLRAFDAGAGTLDWSVKLPNQYAFSSAPTAVNGIVYVGGAGSGGTLYAVSETTGALLWSQPVMNGDDSAPAVTSSGVYVTYACQQDYAFDPVQGTQLWHHSTGCEGGGGQTPSLSGGRVYDLNTAFNSTTGVTAPPVVLDATTGTEVGSFSATQLPAFDNGLGFFLNSGTLRGITLSTGTVDWSFAGDGTLDTAPVVAGGKVYIAGTSGILDAVDESTGALTWSQPLKGSPACTSACEDSGFAIGEGMLLTPVGSTLSAYTTMTAPVVTGVSPGAGPVAGGATVTVSGSGFSQGVSAVRFGGTAAAAFTVLSDTRLTAVSPPLAAGAVDVSVADAAGSSALSTADRYTAVAPPTVTSLCPASGTTKGGTAVTLTGANLSGVTAVRFGSVAATGVTSLSSTSVRVTTPAEPAGTVAVPVTTSAGGTGSGPATYTFTGAKKPGGC